MKLAVSNIGWDVTEEELVLRLLQFHGVKGIEVAPTKLWPKWSGATPQAATVTRRRLAGLGFEIPAIQSVLFDRPDLRLFSGGDAARLAVHEHLSKVGQLACALGAQAVVFGSPRNRDRGAIDNEDAMELALSFFRSVGAEFAELGVCLCIEANPPKYGCNFLTHWSEALELVRRVDNPGIGLHLDVACTDLAGDDPVRAVESCGTHLRHFHISEPELGRFSQPRIDHAAVGKALHASGYDGWISIEMRRQEDSIRAIDEAISYAKRCYARS